MADNQPEDAYRAQAARVIARKEAEMARLQDSINATQRGIKKMYKELLNEEDVKSSVSQEMIAGMKGQTAVSSVLEKLMGRQKTADGLNTDGIERFNNIDNAPTGMEDRYWERE
jgi:predicted CopG family antitoxin